MNSPVKKAPLASDYHPLTNKFMPPQQLLSLF